ncbi:MAG: PaaI family thioesterase [Myxococcota bacterium]
MTPPLDPSEVNAMLDTHWPSAPCRCVELSPTHALALVVPAESALRPGGFISGPTQFGVADAALWFLVAGATGVPQPMALTSDLSIRFLRPARGTKLQARADLERAGRRLVVGTVRVWVDEDQERPCATAQGTYALPD